MGKTWILHTETKGTGAEMVPLERVTKRARAAKEQPFVAPKPRIKEPDQPTPKVPHRFRVVNLMTRETLADDVGVRDALDALDGIRSVVDVNIFVWDEQRERWRLLTFSEKHALWKLATA